MSDTAHRLRIFLCHVSEDKPKVKSLYSSLINDGFEVWLDSENLLPGQDWQREIPIAVRNSDVVLVCLSKQFVVKEGYGQKEIRLVLDNADEKPEGTIYVIPIRLEYCPVPERLKRWHYLNLDEEDSYEKLKRSLTARAEELNINVYEGGNDDREIKAKALSQTPFSSAQANIDLSNYYINVCNESPKTAIHISDVVSDYLNRIRTDRNRIQIEYILTNEDAVQFEFVPLPKVFTQLQVTFSHANEEMVLELNEQSQIKAIKAIADNKHIVIVGDPGAGKTTLLNYLAIMMASLIDKEVEDSYRTEMQERLRIDSENSWEGKSYFPVSLSLLEFSKSQEFTDDGASSVNLSKFIVKKIMGAYELYQSDIHDAVVNYIKKLLEGGHALILLDGLDHLPGEIGDGPQNTQIARERNRLKNILNSFAAEYPKNRVIVTSRRHAYRRNDDWHLNSMFSTAELQPFKPEQITEFIGYWHREILSIEHNKSRNKLGSIIAPDQDARSNQAASSYAKEIISTPHMRELASNPLLLTYMVCRYHPRLGAPSITRVHLYREIIQLLSERWARHTEREQLIKDDEGLNLWQRLRLKNLDQLIKLLSIVAFRAQSPGISSTKSQINSEPITEITLKLAWEKIKESYSISGEVSPDTWEDFKSRTGILLPAETIQGIEGSLERFEFPHQSLREALSAIAIRSVSRLFLPPEWLNNYVSNDTPLSEEDIIIGMLRHQWERWWVVCLLVMEMVWDESPVNLERIIERLVPEIATESTQSEDAFTEPAPRSSILAAQFVCLNIDDKRSFKLAKKISNSLAFALESSLYSADDAQEAGRYLGLLGDERVTLNFNNDIVWNPNRANFTRNIWVLISSQKIKLGIPPGYRAISDSEKRPKDAQRYIDEFYISRYQVTNELFNEFIDKGYNNSQYWEWSNKSLDWHKANDPMIIDVQKELLNAPRVNVSWYEAIAFCHWLTDINPFGLKISLPSEWQWLSSVSFGKDIYYPDNDKDYIFRTHILSPLVGPCPVGIYPPIQNGLFDICGNVAEWTLSKWQSNHNNNELLNLEGDHNSLRVVVGSSYKDADAYIQRRRPLKQSERYADIGFRLILKKST